MSSASSCSRKKPSARAVSCPVILIPARLSIPAVLLVCLLPVCLRAAAPSLKGVFPPGGMRGTEMEVTLEGQMEKGQVWIEGEGVTFSAPDEKGLVKAKITPEAAPGIRLLRVFNVEGVSEAVRFVVGTLPEMKETQPNHAPDKAMMLEKLPVCVNGKIDKGGDMDHFAFSLKKGQSLRLELLAYTLGSPIDPLLHVLDEKGTRLATASDGRNLDPVLTFTAPADGHYVAQIAGFTHPPAADVSFTGGSTVVYRLALQPGPVATRLFPAAVSVEKPTSLTRRGVGLSKETAAYEVPKTAAPATGRIASLAMPDGILPVDVLVSTAVPQVESEPNDKADQAKGAAPLPAVFGGALMARGDSDRFAVPVKKGQKLRAEVFSQRLGLPLDAALKVFDETGKVLGSADDQKDHGDPVVNWTAAADGMHQVMVSDQFHRGGEAHEYVLEVAEVTPAFEVTLPDAKPLKAVPGKKVELKVSVKLLDGWKDPLVVRVTGLTKPHLISKIEMPVPAKGGDVTFAIEPMAEFPAGMHPFHVVVCKPDGSECQVATYDLRGENRRGTSQSDRDETLWLMTTSMFVGPPSPDQ